MYEYIKGHKVELEEHMLSASEIAVMYGIYTEKGQPHSLMVAAILREYVNNNNLNVAEYYYPYNRGCMRVYPKIVWNPAFLDFYYKNNLDFVGIDKQLFYEDKKENVRVYDLKSEKKKFVYVHKSNNVQSNKINNIIDLSERRK